MLYFSDLSAVCFFFLTGIYFLFYLLLFIFIFTLQYCISFGIHQHEHVLFLAFPRVRTFHPSRLPLRSVSWIQLCLQYFPLWCLSDGPFKWDRPHTDPPQGMRASSLVPSHQEIPADAMDPTVYASLGIILVSSISPTSYTWCCLQIAAVSDHPSSLPSHIPNPGHQHLSPV